ncbi:MAG TPA: hypothetical protein VJ824_04545 [Bacillota bacterium]|nr:hypothetical protein [Bacillota bacterium]
MTDYKRSSSKWGIVLVIVGCLLLFGQLGIHLGWILGFIIPVILVKKGWKWLNLSQSGFRRFVGAAFLGVGAIWLIGMLPILIGLALSMSIIYFGWRMIRNKRACPVMESEAYYRSDSSYSPFHTYKPMDGLDEWEKNLHNRKTI